MLLLVLSFGATLISRYYVPISLAIVLNVFVLVLHFISARKPFCKPETFKENLKAIKWLNEAQKVEMCNVYLYCTLDQEILETREVYYRWCS